MDKQLLKAYIRTIVEEEVKRLLPELLTEAVQEIKKVSKLNETSTTPTSQKPKIDRGRLAELMGITYDRENSTITANTSNMLTTTDAAGNKIQIPASAVPTEVVTAITKDYSQLMKAMKLT
jgi:hypothetical protein